MSGIFKAYDIRGIYGQQLTEEIAEKIGRAYVVFTGAKKVVVGRDMRPHSVPLMKAITKGILEQGADVIDIGMCSTPMSYHANGYLHADGSIMITASHNTAEWNGFKLCKANAVPISGATGIFEIEKIVENNLFSPVFSKGTLTFYDISEQYKNFLRSYAKIDRKLTVVVDFANAMGSKEFAGIRDFFNVIPMYEELDGTFPNHVANPLQLETLNDICRKVKETGADFGAAFDGDADRCGFIDNKGEIIPMDLFTALLAMDTLNNAEKGEQQTILYDLRSSWSVKEAIEKCGGKASMSRVGHAFIKNQMRQENAVMAGELSGHYYFRENYVAESQGLAIVKLANLLCKENVQLCDMVEKLKKYSQSGEINFKVKNTQTILDKIRQKFSDGHLFELDGISVEYDDWWFNVRASNTEPLLRLIVEAKQKEKMEKMRNELIAIIQED